MSAIDLSAAEARNIANRAELAKEIKQLEGEAEMRFY